MTDSTPAEALNANHFHARGGRVWNDGLKDPDQRWGIDPEEKFVPTRTVTVPLTRVDDSRTAVRVEGMTGAEMIVAERATHAARGWTIEHDLAHDPGDLVTVSLAFLLNDHAELPEDWHGCAPKGGARHAEVARRLIVAGSLIAAELDCMVARGEVELEPSPAQTVAWMETAQCPFDCDVCRSGEDE